jgi:PAS fold
VRQTQANFGIGTLARTPVQRQHKRKPRASQETHPAEARQPSHTGSFGWNPASGEIFWSKESFRIFGYESTVKPTLDLVLERAHPDDAVRVREAVERARNERQSFLDTPVFGEAAVGLKHSEYPAGGVRVAASRKDAPPHYTGSWVFHASSTGRA